MGLRLSTGARNAALDGTLQTAWDTDGRIAIFTGAQPTTAEMDGAIPPAAQTLLGTLSLSADAFAAASSGAIAANAITSDTNADATGTAAWFIIYKAADGLTSGASKVRISVTCGQGSGDLSFDSTSIVAGGTIAISALTLTMPAS